MNPEIHISDRILFKRCRRKWDWQSTLRQNLVPREGRPSSALWFGTGWHFAMEDWHGYRRFPRMAEAFAAYVYAFASSNRPENWDELLDLGMGMADYYSEQWLPLHNEYQTVWQHDDGTLSTIRAPGAVPQVEVKSSFIIPGRDDGALSAGTFDAIVADPWGRLWIKEIKTASRIDTLKLDTDPQVSAYYLAAVQHYRQPIEGVLYIQFVKAVPERPPLLKNGTFSLAKTQKTTVSVYRDTLIRHFGRVPPEYREFLSYLTDKETDNGNGFIRIDMIHRNEANAVSELWKLQAETNDMLNREIALYPNPTRDCAWDCDFKGACLALDDDSGWQSILDGEFIAAVGRDESWRERITYPDAVFA